MRTTMALLLFVFAAATIASTPRAGAQSGGGPQGFPGEPPSAQFVRDQKKAEALFDAGKYRKAFWYYSKELAPKGDKYAQYMVAHMLENGLGVPRNTVDAAAWYMLAAERGHSELVAVSLARQQNLLASERAVVQKAALNLKTEYGDRALVERLIRRDVRRLREQTGSRVGSCNQNLRVIEVGGVNGVRSSIDGYCKKLNRRIDARIRYITGYIEYGDLEMVEDELDNPANVDDATNTTPPKEQSEQP